MRNNSWALFLFALTRLHCSFLNRKISAFTFALLRSLFFMLVLTRFRFPVALPCVYTQYIYGCTVYTHILIQPTNSLSAQTHKHTISEQGSKNVTVRTREKVRTGQPERDSQNVTARTGQPECDSQNRKGRWGQAEWNKRNRTDRTRQKVNARTGLPGHYCQDSTAKTVLPGPDC